MGSMYLNRRTRVGTVAVGIDIVLVTSNPPTDGQTASLGSMAINTDNGKWWRKYGAAATNWVEVAPFP